MCQAKEPGLHLQGQLFLNLFALIARVQVFMCYSSAIVYIHSFYYSYVFIIREYIRGQ